MQIKQNKKQNKPHPLLWFLFAIIIPMTLAIVLTLFVLSLSGVDVTGWTKDKLSRAPVINSLITSTEEQDLKDEIEKSESKITQQSSEVETLTQTIDDLETQITKREEEILKLENDQTNVLTASQDSEEQEAQDKQMYKNMAGSFKKMNPKQAAAIFEQLDPDIAINILTEMSNDVRGNVFEGMDPKEAAKLAEVFVK